MGFFKSLKKAILGTVKEMGKPLKDLNDSFTHTIRVGQKKSEERRERRRRRMKKGG